MQIYRAISKFGASHFANCGLVAQVVERRTENTCVKCFCINIFPCYLSNNNKLQISVISLISSKVCYNLCYNFIFETYFLVTKPYPIIVTTFTNVTKVVTKLQKYYINLRSIKWS